MIDDPYVARVGAEIDSLIGSYVPSVSSKTEVISRDDGSTIDVHLKHATDNDEVRVRVSRSATMMNVLEAVAMKLGRPAILSSGRLVRKQQGGMLIAFGKTELVGTHTRLLYLGPELTPTAEAKLPADSAQGEDPAGLTLQSAMKLNSELLVAFKADAFQQRLWEIYEASGLNSNTFAYQKERMKL